MDPVPRRAHELKGAARFQDYYGEWFCLKLDCKDLATCIAAGVTKKKAHVHSICTSASQPHSRFAGHQACPSDFIALCYTPSIYRVQRLSGNGGYHGFLPAQRHGSIIHNHLERSKRHKYLLTYRYCSVSLTLSSWSPA
jgi:hypothetical protein